MVVAGTIGADIPGAWGDLTPAEAPDAKQHRTPATAFSNEASAGKHRQALAAEQRQAVAANTVKRAMADRAARHARQRASRSATRTFSGDPRGIARSMASSRYRWGGGQFGCLNSLWQRESRWNHRASNASGAYGIPQALPGSKMASQGADWRTNPATQIAWGLSYIDRTYGSPCAAWSKARAQGWY